jgi:hypothetical protein
LKKCGCSDIIEIYSITNSLICRRKMRTRINFAFFIGLLPLFLWNSATAQPAAILDSLSGTAVVQRAGTVTWVPINRDDQLLNNDMLRINKGSFGMIRWPDNSEAFVQGGTQILVNIGPNVIENRILSYATVFMGSVFFVIKKALPKKLGEDIQIYTPTTVISIRGTAFAVQVEDTSGRTSVKVVSGTVRVSCTATKKSAFMSAPFKTVIGKRPAPIVTNALLTADIDSLKNWVPSQVVDFEIARQLSKSKRDRFILSGALYEKCHISPFTNTSNYSGEWNIGPAVTKLLSDKIRSVTNRLDVHVADSATDSGTTSPGKQAPDRFTITGSIVFFDIVNHAEITVRADEYRERSIGRITLEVELHDTKRGSEVFSTTVAGERSGKKNSDNSWNTISQFPFDLNNEKFASSIIGSALEQVLDAATEKLIMKMYE